MPKLIIDGRQIEIEAGATILDAARKIGIDIPTMCYLAGHSAQTSCMVCVVKVEGRSGLVPACATRVEDGMVVDNGTDEVTTARRTALELLLGDHLGDCVGPCHSACPAHMDIPAMIRQINERRYREAIITIKEHIPLPATLGRICPEICEKACRRAVVDAPVSICLLKRFAADIDLASNQPYLPECKPSSGKRVSIIGSGPAGLTAAYYLLQQGHACTVFDDHPLPGGMLRFGIPADRLPREVLDAEIALIMKLGAEFRPNTRIDSAKSFDDICRSSDAVLLAIGKTDLEDGIWKGLQIDRTTMMTSHPGVFAAGSVMSPSRYAVRAVADGRAAALAIDNFLKNKHVETRHRPYSVHIGRLTKDEISTYTLGVDDSGRIMPSGSGFSEDEACMESRRCMHCECGKQHGCKLRDYGIEYKASLTAYKGERQKMIRESDHPFVIYEPGKCISCGLCVQITTKAGEPLGLTFIGRGFNVRPGMPFSEPLSKALIKVADECAKACPTGALVMKDKGS